MSDLIADDYLLHTDRESWGDDQRPGDVFADGTVTDADRVVWLDTDEYRGES